MTKKDEKYLSIALFIAVLFIAMIGESVVEWVLNMVCK